MLLCDATMTHHSKKRGKKLPAELSEEGLSVSNPAANSLESDSSTANASPDGAVATAGYASSASSDAASPEKDLPATERTQDIIQRLDSMKNDFTSKFLGVLSAIQGVKADVRGFLDRMDEAEQRISSVEDTIKTGKEGTDMLIKQIDLLTSKVDELENYSRKRNIRLVNLPSGVEKDDPVGFITKWLPDALGAETFPSPLFIEAAHRVPARQPQTQSNRRRPPVFIVRFLNFQDKVKAMKAAKTKKKVMCGDQDVMFFPDLTAELHRRRKKFDAVKQQLKSLNIRYGLMFPAKLKVWKEDGHTQEFNTPEDAEKFVQGLKHAEVTQEI